MIKIDKGIRFKKIIINSQKGKDKQGDTNKSRKTMMNSKKKKEINSQKKQKGRINRKKTAK